MQQTYRTERVAEIPRRAQMQPGILYHFTGHPDAPSSSLWKDGSVGFLCPCGCGEDVTLPVARDAGTAQQSEHLWHFDPDTITIAPSVSHRAGCRSHYFITNGRLKNLGRKPAPAE